MLTALSSFEQSTVCSATLYPSLQSDASFMYFSGFNFNEPLLMCVPRGKSSDGYKPMVSTTLLSCCLASAFVFYYEFSILYGLILIKLSFPFLPFCILYGAELSFLPPIAFVFYYEFSILYGLILIKLSFPFLSFLHFDWTGLS